MDEGSHWLPFALGLVVWRWSIAVQNRGREYLFYESSHDVSMSVLKSVHYNNMRTFSIYQICALIYLGLENSYNTSETSVVHQKHARVHFGGFKIFHPREGGYIFLAPSC
jgi:hypothetical protein